MKNNIKYILALIYIFLFVACNDSSYIINIYNKDLLDQKVECLKLQIEPNSKEIYNSVQKLYSFSLAFDCRDSLKIRYKSDIVCNSPYSTNKTFHSFVDLSLAKDDKVYFSVYKDLKDNKNLQNEIDMIFKNYIAEHIDR